MATINEKERQMLPLVTLLRGNQLTAAQKAGVWFGIILTGCAIGVFIWLVVRAARYGDSRGIVMASSFILFAVGFLYFFLARINNPKRAWIFLYVTIPLAVGAFVISLYLNGGANAPYEDMQNAELIQNTYDASDGTAVQNE